MGGGSPFPLGGGLGGLPQGNFGNMPSFCGHLGIKIGRYHTKSITIFSSVNQIFLILDDCDSGLGSDDSSFESDID